MCNWWAIQRSLQGEKNLSRDPFLRGLRGAPKGRVAWPIPLQEHDKMNTIFDFKVVYCWVSPIPFWLGSVGPISHQDWREPNPFLGWDHLRLVGRRDCRGSINKIKMKGMSMIRCIAGLDMLCRCTQINFPRDREAYIRQIWNYAQKALLSRRIHWCGYCGKKSHFLFLESYS